MAIRKAIRIPKPKAAKKVVKPRVPRTRNLNTQTDSMHMGQIRSALRAMTRFSWKPISIVRKAAQRGWCTVTAKGKAKRVPQYECSICNAVVTKIQIDHKTPAGSLRTYEDLPLFCQRLFCENINDLRATCVPCHQLITNEI